MDTTLSAGTDMRSMANAIRALSMDAVEAAKSGHPGMPMGCADIATVLATRFMKFDPADPEWPDRDRFVLSAGHGSMLLYSMLYLLGYPDMTLDELRNFRQLGSRTPGHPEYGHAPGVETTTGPLGQGLATAVGMALAERSMAARFGHAVVDHHTYVIAGDGCLMEGVSHEAISFAGHQRLGKLIVLFDDNHVSIDGATSLSVSDDQLARFAASGWHTQACDGHDPDAIAAAVTAAQADDRPSMIACRTTIGYGAPNKAGTSGAHGSPLGAEEIAKTREALNWPHAPFEIPDEILSAWRTAGARGKADRDAWSRRLGELEADQRAAWDEAYGLGYDPARLAASLADQKRALVADKPAWATRRSSQAALESFVEAVPALLGGSADLSGSNNTKVKPMEASTPDNPGGRYVHYGVREHGMVAAMNGIALHKGLIPYGGTFLVFTDYCRPAIRLAALMGVRNIMVMTHDSIGLGEDGPTHQPVEHLAALRAIPNVDVYRPADAVEAAESWAAAIEKADGPSVLVLTRQGLPLQRVEADKDTENLTARGGYVLREPASGRDVTLMASGSEVPIAVEAAELLAADGIAAAVVSMVCFERFDAQPEDYRQKVLGAAPRLAIEAAVAFGWTRYVDAEADVVGMPGFGASGPFKELYAHFGITAEGLAAKAKAKLGR